VLVHAVKTYMGKEG